MNIKNIAIGVLAVAVLGLGLSALIKAPVQVKVENPTSVTGSLTGPDISSPYLAVNRVSHEYRHCDWTLVPSTGVVCILTSPSATSTLLVANGAVTTASSTATTWQWNKATSTDATTGASFATGTKIASYALSSGAVGTFFPTATSTSATAPAVDDTLVFGPNTALVIRVTGTAYADSSKLNGFANAEFLVAR